jgi:two-component system, response regulator PdtaR
VKSKILIVEDEIVIALDLKMRLEKLGYDIPGVAFNGRDAIQKTGEIVPDLILMDILLNGEIDGIEAAQQIRELHNIPFIYVTGSYDNSIFERAKITEPAGFIKKPFDDTEIETAIQTAITQQNSD